MNSVEYLRLTFKEISELYRIKSLPLPPQMKEDDLFYFTSDKIADSFASDICSYGQESKAQTKHNGTPLSCDPRAYCVPGLFNLVMWPTEESYDGEDVTTWIFPKSFIYFTPRELEYTMGELHIEHEDKDCPIFNCLECSQIE